MKQLKSFLAQRKARPLNDLLPSTRRWSETLPDSAKPYQLMQTYPRLANRIANAWRDRERSLMILDDLLTDRRGGRQGLPPFVVAELLRLRALLDAGPNPISR